MDTARKFVVCSVDDRRFALELSGIERVVRAVEITPVPEAPPIILGVIKVKDRVLPVVNVRRRLGLPERDLRLSDEMVVAHVSHGQLVLLVDEVLSLISCKEGDIVPARKILNELNAIDGIAKTAEGLVIVEDLERFLSLDEARFLHEVPSPHA